MKKIILSFLIFAVLQIVYSQSGWFWQNPYPTGSQLNDVFFVNENVAYAVGWCGVVIKTTNGGSNWIQCNTGTNYFLMSVFFINEHTGFSVAGSYNYYPPKGAILRTTNGGLNWDIIQLNNTSLNSVYFVDVSTGYVSGIYGDDYGILFKTTNSGQNWIQVTNLPACFFLSRVHFLNYNTGFISDDQQVLKTTNGGANWTSTGVGVLSGLLSVFFPTFDTGYACGYYGKIYKTSNSGVNWVLIASDDSTHLRSVTFINAHTGFVVGGNRTNNFPGKVKRTTDGGITWDSLYYGYQANLMGLSVINNSLLVVGAYGAISKSNDLGINWMPITSYLTADALKKIEFFNSTGIIIGISNTILKCSDSGNNWFAINSGTNYQFNDLEIIDNNSFVICCNSGKVIKTTDGGISWTTINTGTNINLLSMDFVNQNTGYASGYSFIYPPGLYSASVLKSTNSGLNWYTLYGESNVFNACYFLDENTGFVSSYGSVSSRILKTINGGLNWVQISLPANSAVLCFYFLNSMTGFAGGRMNEQWGSYSLLKTTDSGNSWATVNIYLSYDFYINSIFFTSPSVGYLACESHPDWGPGGDLFKTIDGGNTWYHYANVPLYPGYTSVLNSLTFIDDDIGFVVGNRGAILKTIDGGNIMSIAGLQHTIPHTISLHQNYPNPFNPTTKIRFDIPPLEGARGRVVRVVIYDLLGREVATLVNEPLLPGTYEVEWNGNSFASGIYFYKLIANDFVESRKMILIK